MTMKVFNIIALTGASLSVMLACSGGGGGSGGGGSTSLSMLATNKLSCAGSTCIGSGSLSMMSDSINVFAVTDAVNYYNGFNTQMIPALNNIIRIIETGAGNAGAENCTDIGIFTGPLTVDGIAYNGKSATTSLAAPASFTTVTTNKKLSAELVSSGVDVIEASVWCGLTTDASPLVARVLSLNGTTKLNAWFEKGSANHIRILMFADNGTKYGAWFKTDDGVNFEMVLASSGAVYKAVGNKATDRISFRGLGDSSDSCLVASTGASTTGCGSMSTTNITVTEIPTTLTTTAKAWADMPTAAAVAPVF